MDDGVEVRYRSAGARLFARSWGEGRPLVLLHGSGLATHAMFSGLAAELVGTCRAIACDVRGFGQSLSPNLMDHTWRQYAADVVALLDHLGLRTAVIGGYSFGAGIAVASALAHADRFAGLVLAGPAYAGSEIGQIESQRAIWARGRSFFEQARRHGLEPSLLATAASEAERKRLRRSVAEHDELSFLVAHQGELQTAQPFPGLGALESITVPALLLSGADDSHDPQIARWYAEHLPVTTLTTSGGSDPAYWADDVRVFLKQL